MIPFTKKWRVNRRWKSRHRALLKEDIFYKKEFDELNLSYLTTKDISSSLKAKNIFLPRHEKLNILAIFKHHNWENFSLIPALKKFGEVFHFDWSHLLNEKNINKNKINKLLIEYFDNLNKKQKIDLIFGYFSGESIDESTLIYFKEKGVPIINLSLNDRELFVGKIRKGKAQGIRDICKHVSISWTSSESAVKKILVEGGTPIYMPEGANPEIHKPYPDEKKVYPVSFVGACYGRRPFIINELRSKGIEVYTFGVGWPTGPIEIEQMVRTYSRSKINLGFSGIGSYEDLYCLKGRDFEIPMSGGLYLTEHNEELTNFFKIGKEILTWNNVNELVEKIHYLQSNDELCSRISSEGLRVSLEKHSWETRIGSIIHLIKTNDKL